MAARKKPAAAEPEVAEPEVPEYVEPSKRTDPSQPQQRPRPKPGE